MLLTLDHALHDMRRNTGAIERLSAIYPPRPRLIGVYAPPMIPPRWAVAGPLVAAIRQPEPGP